MTSEESAAAPVVRMLRRGQYGVVLLAAGFLYAVVEAGLRTTSLTRLAAMAGVVLDFEAADPVVGERPSFTYSERRRIRAVRRWSPKLYGTERGCLRRSLVLGFMLRSRHPHLKIGVRRAADGTLQGHAWIEIEGYRLDAPTGFLPFDVPA